MKCTLHKTEQLKYFCQTCLDPICQQCSQISPHSDQYHKIQPLQQAIYNRKKRFQMYISKQINPLRQNVRTKFIELKQIEQKILHTKSIIQKDILLQFQAIQQRTNDQTQKKKMQNQTQIKYYQSYLNVVDDLAYTFEKISQDPYNFLILYKQINNQLKNLESQQIKHKIQSFNINQQPQSNSQQNSLQNSIQNKQSLNTQTLKSRHIIQKSLKREIKQTYQILTTIDSLKNRNLLINGLIGKASEYYKSQDKKIKKNTVDQLKNILNLYNQTNYNLLKMNTCKSCAFCQCPFTMDNCNDHCQTNKSIKSQLSTNYSHVTIAQQFKGCKRHFWVDSAPKNRKLPNIQAHSIIRGNLKKQFLNSLKELSSIKCCFKKYEIQTGKNFMQCFEKQDKQKKKTLSVISFKYILTKIFEMEQSHSEVLIQLLSYNWKEPIKRQIKKTQALSEIKQSQIHINSQLKPLVSSCLINYSLLPYLLQNPLFPYEQYLLLEQQLQKNKPIAPQSRQIKKYKY